MKSRITKTNPWAQQCRLCWEQLEWRAWPDTRTSEIIDTMAQAWAQLPQELRGQRWGQPLAPSIAASWEVAMDRELGRAKLSRQAA